MKHGIFQAIAIGLVFSAAFAQTGKIPLQENNKLSFSQVYTKKENLVLMNDLVLTVNAGDTSKGQHQTMIADLGFSQVYVPDSTTGTFGINCDDQNLCTKSAQTEQCQYSLDTPCVSASTILRFNQVKMPDQPVPALPFKLFTGKDDWVSNYDKNGVLGMSPKSSFWTYLLSSYNTQVDKDYIDVSLNYAIKDKSDTYNLNKVVFKNSQMTIGGRQSKNDLDLVKLTQVGDSWVIPSVTLSFWRGDKRTVDLCVDNTINSFFMLSANYLSEVTKNINNQLCNKDDGCDRKKSAILNVDNISAAYMNTNVTLASREFVEFIDADKAAIGITAIAASRPCSAYSYAVGRLFFTKAELTIRVSDGPSFQLGFSDLTDSGNTTPVLIMLIVTLALSVISAGLMQKFFPKKLPDGLIANDFN